MNETYKISTTTKIDSRKRKIRSRKDNMYYYGNINKKYDKAKKDHLWEKRGSFYRKKGKRIYKK
jgi:hypothetical protein